MLPLIPEIYSHLKSRIGNTYPSMSSSLCDFGFLLSRLARREGPWHRQSDVTPF